MDDALKIVSVGVTVNVTPTSLATPSMLPTNAAGEFPRQAVFTVDTGVAYLKLGALGTPGSLMTSTLNDLMINSAYPQLLNTRGQAVFNVVTRLGTCNINVAPVEA